MLGPRRPWCTPDAAHADEESTGRIVDRLVVTRCTDVASTTFRSVSSSASRSWTTRASASAGAVETTTPASHGDRDAPDHVFISGPTPKHPAPSAILGYPGGPGRALTAVAWPTWACR